MVEAPPYSVVSSSSPSKPSYNRPTRTNLVALSLGTRVGTYEILTLLGAGGMGEVYRARDTKLNRDVALKVLPAEFALDRDRLARFKREAQVLASLSHPNIAAIYGFEDSDGIQALVLELVAGITLADRIAQGPVPLEEALRIARQIADALEAAHEQGIIHRDLKPANVVLQKAGASGLPRSDIRAKVLDFGLAKPFVLLAPDSPTVHPASSFDRTSEGQIVGTPAYMSPEQTRGQAADKRTDIWAFGCVIFEMLSGRRPFEANTATDTFARILEHEPDWSLLPSTTPALVRKLLERSLQKDLSRRLRDIGDARLDLEDAVDGQPAGTPSNIGSTIARRRGMLTAAAVVIALGAAAGGWWWSSKSRDARRSATGTTMSGSVGRSLTRLTFGPGLQTNATWSPDGRSIAFASDQAGNFDIWVKPVAGGDGVQLTRSPAADTQPAWSPDGRSIVFQSEREGGGLFIVPVSGGPERQLTSFGVHPQWTPDGTEIFFRSGIAMTSVTGVNIMSGLYIVPAAGGDPPRAILQSFLSGGAWLWIAAHPDGRISALGQHPTSGWGFFTISRDGRHVIRSQLATDLPLRLGNSELSGQGTRVVRFQWNGTGTAIYVEAIVNEVQSVWRVEVDKKSLQWLSAERLTTGAGADAHVAVSADDTRLAFTTEQHASRLWAFPFDASRGTILGKGTPLTPEEDRVTESDLAPDGSRIAYALKRAGSGQVDLWSINLDGGRRELLAQNAISGIWAPHGRAFAYSLFRADSGEWALAVRTSDGPERLLSPWSRESVFGASNWTPDGSALLGSYSSPLSAPAVLAVWPTAKPASKPSRIMLAVPDASLWQAHLSPDARWIACVVQRHGGSQAVELVVAPVTSGSASGMTQIAADHAWADKPRWAPDGKTLYFISRQHAGDPFDLWDVRFNPETGVVGTPFKITHFGTPGPMISPEVTFTEIGIAERWAVLTMETVTGNIWMLDNVKK